MSGATLQHRVDDLREDWQFNRAAVGLMLAMVLTELVGLQVLSWMASSGGEMGGTGAVSTQYGDPSSPFTAGRLLVFWAVEIVILVGAYFLYKRLPEWICDALKEGVWDAVLFSIIGSLAASFAAGVSLAFALWFVLSIAVGWVLLTLILRALKQFDLLWVIWNLAAVMLAGYFGAALAKIVSLGPLLAILAVFVLLDPIGVTKLGVIQRFASFAGSARLPLFVLVPSGWRFDLELLDDMEENLVESGTTVLGCGDLAFPMALAAAANRVASPTVTSVGALNITTTGAGTLAGAVLGVGILAGLVTDTERALPALPPIIAVTVVGGLAGYALGVII